MGLKKNESYQPVKGIDTVSIIQNVGNSGRNERISKKEATK